MHWIAPSEKDTANGTLEERLWDSADQFRANSGQAECRIPKCEFGIAGSSSFEIRHSSFAIAPSCIVRLLTEVIEPYHGRILETLRLANVPSIKCGMNRAKHPCVRGNRCNLDIKNPHDPGTTLGDLDKLLAEYQQLLAAVNETREKLRKELESALGAGSTKA